MPIAIQSATVLGLLVFVISIGAVGFPLPLGEVGAKRRVRVFFGRFLFGGYAISFSCPVPQVDEFAALAAKRTIRIPFVL